MNKILVQLPANRDYAGTLEIQNTAGKRIAGPFCVCGRSDDEAVRSHKTPNRDPLLPFGDIPCGEYQVAKILPSGPRTFYSADEFGPAGVILLLPLLGDAALADANGRHGFFIQGGARSRNRRLRPTQDGSLRLSDRDQQKFIKALQKAGDINCHCLIVCTSKAGAKVAVATVELANRSRRNRLAKELLASAMAIRLIANWTIREASEHVFSHAARASVATSVAAGAFLLTEDRASAQTRDYPPSDFVVQLSDQTTSDTPSTPTLQSTPDQADEARVATLANAIGDAEKKWGSSSTNQCNLGVQGIQQAVGEQVVTGQANVMVKAYQKGTQGANPTYATVSAADAEAIASAGYLVVAARAAQPGETHGHVAVVSPNTTGWIGTPYRNPKLPIIGNIGNNKNSSDTPINYVFGKVRGSKAPAVPPTYYVSTTALNKYKAQQGQASQNPSK